jgi:hypothetical protein
MKIAFFSPHLCIQGTTVALYDYAHYNENILGNESYIMYEREHKFNDSTVMEKFHNRFHRVYGMSDISRLDHILSINKCDAVYIIKQGYKNDGRMASACKTLIHVVGMAPPSEKHGDVYAYVSYWLSKECSNNTIPVVPYMVDLPDDNKNMRKELKIPDNGRTIY